jgi:hypothetical protein
VAAQADKIEHEFEIAFLRLRGRRLQARDDGGSSHYACDQRSRHVWLLDLRTAPSAQLE